jgi:hypothetical protein
MYIYIYSSGEKKKKKKLISLSYTKMGYTAKSFPIPDRLSLLLSVHIIIDTPIIRVGHLALSYGIFCSRDI